MDLEQVYVSAVAFSAVFAMLTLLAGLMSLLTRVFPGKELERKRKKAATPGPDEQLVAAVTAAVTTVIPGGRVTKIEEVK